MAIIEPPGYGGSVWLNSDSIGSLRVGCRLYADQPAVSSIMVRFHRTPDPTMIFVGGHESMWSRDYAVVLVGYELEDGGSTTRGLVNRACCSAVDRGPERHVGNR